MAGRAQNPGQTFGVRCPRIQPQSLAQPVLRLHLHRAVTLHPTPRPPEQTDGCGGMKGPVWQAKRASRSTSASSHGPPACNDRQSTEQRQIGLTFALRCAHPVADHRRRSRFAHAPPPNQGDLAEGQRQGVSHWNSLQLGSSLIRRDNRLAVSVFGHDHVNL